MQAGKTVCFRNVIVTGVAVLHDMGEVSLWLVSLMAAVVFYCKYTHLYWNHTFLFVQSAHALSPHHFSSLHPSHLWKIWCKKCCLETFLTLFLRPMCLQLGAMATSKNTQHQQLGCKSVMSPEALSSESDLPYCHISLPGCFCASKIHFLPQIAIVTYVVSYICQVLVCVCLWRCFWMLKCSWRC